MSAKRKRVMELAPETPMTQLIEQERAIKRIALDESNRDEFITNQQEGCARTAAVLDHRHIPARVVSTNEDSVLSRSITTVTDKHRLQQIERGVQHAGGRKSGGLLMPNAAVHERLTRLEDHLSLHYGPQCLCYNGVEMPMPPDVYARIKALEERVMQLERDHPVWASRHLNQPGREDEGRA
jgi:hypothetical protein